MLPVLPDHRSLRLLQMESAKIRIAESEFFHHACFIYLKYSKLRKIVMKAVFFMIFLLSCPFSIWAQTTFSVQGAKKDITLTGYTRSDTVITISSEVSGKMLRVNYDLGQRIAKKPFFEIDPTFINFQIQSTRQSLKKLKIVLEKIRSRVAYLEKEFRRIEQLHKGDRATEVRRDAAEEDLRQGRFEAQTTEIERAVLEIALKELRERKRRHSIYASKGWVVVEKIVEKGEIVSPNMPLAKLADYQRLAVPLFVSGGELDVLKGLPKEFDAFLEGKPVKAVLNWINPEFNEQTRKLNIELLIVQYEGEQRGGLYFSLPLEIRTEGLRIPKAAMVNRYDNPRVTVKDTDETINVMVLGESEAGLIIAEDERLPVGTVLKGAE
ncbi:MAG: hypothetical protein B6245_12760 [Desulfobacteraceae bacterium 4572_88]|nr:MAG: hypothetical protein B6245_12760 [Desulfobacteraceae bacterium 4572_88]